MDLVFGTGNFERCVRDAEGLLGEWRVKEPNFDQLYLEHRPATAARPSLSRGPRGHDADQLAGRRATGDRDRHAMPGEPRPRCQLPPKTLGRNDGRREAATRRAHRAMNRLAWVRRLRRDEAAPQEATRISSRYSTTWRSSAPTCTRFGRRRARSRTLIKAVAADQGGTGP